MTPEMSLILETFPGSIVTHPPDNSERRFWVEWNALCPIPKARDIPKGSGNPFAGVRR